MIQLTPTTNMSTQFDENISMVMSDTDMKMLTETWGDRWSGSRNQIMSNVLLLSAHHTLLVCCTGFPIR